MKVWKKVKEEPTESKTLCEFMPGRLTMVNNILYATFNREI